MMGGSGQHFYERGEGKKKRKFGLKIITKRGGGGKDRTRPRSKRPPKKGGGDKPRRGLERRDDTANRADQGLMRGQKKSEVKHLKRE